MKTTYPNSHNIRFLPASKPDGDSRCGPIQPAFRINRPGRDVMAGGGRHVPVSSKLPAHIPGSRTLAREKFVVVTAVTARDLMSTSLTTLRPEESIEHAARTMSECDSDALPVVDGCGRLIGIITHRDITVRLVACGKSIPEARVRQCMTEEAFACHADSSVEACIRAMAWHQVSHMPVVDGDHRVLGMVSRSELTQYICETVAVRPGLEDVMTVLS